MIKNFFLSIILVLVFMFFFLIFKEYMSENNIKKINKNRNNASKQVVEKTLDLDILINDTSNIIEFNSEFDANINIKKKRKFWELIKN